VSGDIAAAPSTAGPNANEFLAEVRRLQRLGTIARPDAGEELLADFAVGWWRGAYATESRALQRGLPAIRPCNRPGPAILCRMNIAFRTVASPHALLGELSSEVGDDLGRQLLQPVHTESRQHVLIAHLVVAVAPDQRECLACAKSGVREVIDERRIGQARLHALAPTVSGASGLTVRDTCRRLRTALTVRKRTILIDRSVALGSEKGTKTNATRTVRLLAPLAEDLAAWRDDSADAELVFPRADRKPWTDDDYRNWRKRIYRSAALNTPGSMPAAPMTSAIPSSRC